MGKKRKIKSIDPLNVIKESQDKYRQLFENVHDGIYQSTVEGQILTANPALVKMLGYDSEKELMKKNIAKDIYVNASERDTYTDLLRKKGRLEDEELTLKKKDGSFIVVLEHSHIVKDNTGRILYYEGTLRDITERKKAEEERKRMILQLQNALEKVKTLSGLLPICSFCKKIRDDNGYWRQIETYIEAHSEAEFSHGMCQECARKHYPEIYRHKSVEER